MQENRDYYRSVDAAEQRLPASFREALTKARIFFISCGALLWILLAPAKYNVHFLLAILISLGALPFALWIISKELIRRPFRWQHAPAIYHKLALAGVSIGYLLVIAGLLFSITAKSSGLIVNLLGVFLIVATATAYCVSISRVSQVEGQEQQPLLEEEGAVQRPAAYYKINYALIAGMFFSFLQFLYVAAQFHTRPFVLLEFSMCGASLSMFAILLVLWAFFNNKFEKYNRLAAKYKIIAVNIITLAALTATAGWVMMIAFPAVATWTSVVTGYVGVGVLLLATVVHMVHVHLQPQPPAVPLQIIAEPPVDPAVELQALQNIVAALVPAAPHIPHHVPPSALHAQPPMQYPGEGRFLPEPANPPEGSPAPSISEAGGNPALFAPPPHLRERKRSLTPDKPPETPEQTDRNTIA